MATGINPPGGTGSLTRSASGFDNAVTPTLFIGGELDWNVPIINSELMYQSMKRLGRETQLVVYPGQYHGIDDLPYLKDLYERYLAWYGKYVKGEPQVTAAE